MAGAPRFNPGDHVHVASVGKGVVREVRNGGRCLVEIKGRSMLVDATQLAALDEPKRQTKGPATGAAAADVVEETPFRTGVATSIDLHGMTTSEALIALDTFLNDAILAGASEVRVIHGRSGGRVKAAVHGRLKIVSSVRAFRLDPANPGATLITL